MESPPPPVPTEASLRQNLRRCSEETIAAAVSFHEQRNAADAVIIAAGVIERFVEPQVRPLIRQRTDSLRLVDDLGIDSLLMVEIVVVLEDTLLISIPNEELVGLRDFGDLRQYVSGKVEVGPAGMVA